VLVPDLRPATAGADPNFELQTSTNEASERVLRYRAKRSTKTGYREVSAGDTFTFILATPEMVRSAVNEVRKAGPYAAGVAFFRWPTRSEEMVLQPGEVLEAGGFASGASREPRIESVSGGCAAVACADVYLHASPAMLPTESRYTIRSNHPIDYFVPAEGSGAKLAGAHELSVRFPPYTGRGRALLGRVVSERALDFTVELVQ
jgi:hypothetical protein